MFKNPKETLRVLFIKLTYKNKILNITFSYVRNYIKVSLNNIFINL